MSPAQRRALLLILGLVLAGHGVRIWLLEPGAAAGAVTLLEPAGTAALNQQRAASAEAGKPLAQGERVDLNSATAAELARLPRVGPGLARRIVADRAANGPFHSLSDLDRVPGIGPALLAEVRVWVLQSGEGGPGGSAGGGTALANGPAAGTPSRQAAGSPRPSSGPTRPLLDLNSATEAGLLRLPGIGPTKARAIVAYRQARGPFASVGDLILVPGIGPSTLAGLAGLVRVR